MKTRKFKIIDVVVHNWSTDFTIKDLEHTNKQNEMSPEAFIHCIGNLFGKNLEEMEGLEFEILIPDNAKEDTSLNLCGVKLNGK